VRSADHGPHIALAIYMSCMAKASIYWQVYEFPIPKEVVIAEQDLEPRRWSANGNRCFAQGTNKDLAGFGNVLYK